MSKKRINKEQKKLLNRIASQLRKMRKGYVFDPITPDRLNVVKSAIVAMISRVSGSDFEQYIDLQVDPKGSRVILVSPKKDAPPTVHNFFAWWKTLIGRS